MLRGHALDWKTLSFHKAVFPKHFESTTTFISPPPAHYDLESSQNTHFGTVICTYMSSPTGTHSYLILLSNVSIVSCTHSHVWLKQQPAHLALNQALHALAGIFGEAIRKKQEETAGLKNASVTGNVTLSDVNAA